MERNPAIPRTSSGSLDVSASTSFEEFALQTSGRLYRTALLLCGDHHEAEDLTQTTLAKLFASWRRVATSTNPTAYARTTLTRTFISQRRLRRSTERPTDELPESAAPDLDAAQRMDLMAALAKLSPRDRTVVVLRYWEDLDVAQTARLLRISEASCRQRCKRALARLRTHLPTLED